MTHIESPDSHRIDNMIQSYEFERVRDAIFAKIRELGRPIRAKEVEGFSTAAVGKCVDKNTMTFVRVYGCAQRGASQPSYIGLHRNLAAWEPGYHEFGHIVEIKK